MKVIKRFYRDKKNASLFGVCAGLERYTEIDRTVWRCIFLALVFFPFPSILFYLGITLLTPSDMKKKFKEFLLEVGENIYQAWKNGWFPYFILLYTSRLLSMHKRKGNRNRQR
jgi:phage shock protein PspC (stress-responsive transcriptional regulator)